MLLEGLFHRADVVAADIVELAPAPGLHHCEFSAARLAHKMIGMLRKKRLGKRRCPLCQRG